MTPNYQVPYCGMTTNLSQQLNYGSIIAAIIVPSPLLQLGELYHYWNEAVKKSGQLESILVATNGIEK